MTWLAFGAATAGGFFGGVVGAIIRHRRSRRADIFNNRERNEQ